MSPIDLDGANDDHANVEFDASEAFSKLWEPAASDKKKTPAETDADDTSDKADKADVADEDNEDKTTKSEDDADGDADDKSSDDDADKDADKANDDNVDLKDDFKVKVKVDGKEQEFTVGSLKRLAGQEASLTRKSQDVAKDRKELDTRATTHVAALNVLLERANKRYEPYAKIDLLAASKNPDISGEELTALRDAMQAAHEDKQFLTSELGTFQQALRQQKHQELVAQAAETVKVLSDPKKGIPGWSDKVYGDLITYAVSKGVSQDAANEIVDPVSFRILHMAMLYEKGKAKVQETGAAKAKAPKMIVKSISNTGNTKEVTSGAKSKDAMKRLERSGSVDDAANAFEAKWSRD